MVKLIIDEINTQIDGLENLSVIDAISSQLSFMVPGAQYSFPYKSGRWDGRERLLTKTLKFPTGLLTRVCKILESFGISYVIEDKINYPRGNVDIPALVPEPYPYQKEVIKIALDKKRGTIRVATGGGKSIIIAYIAAALDVPTMIYVVSLDLLTQLRSTIESVLGTPVGIIGGGKCEIRRVTVCSVWTAGLACGERIAQTEDDEDLQRDLWEPSTQQRGAIVAAVKSARTVILDESQFAAANSIRMILRNSAAAAYKYGFSATPWRTAGDDLLLEAAFGDRICDISATELINQGYLVRPKIIFRDVPRSGKLKKSWPAVKSNYIINNEERNEMLVKNIRKLVEMGRKPLALFREIKHGEILKEMLGDDIKVRMVNGQMSMEERSGIKGEFEAGDIQVILSSTVYDQGIDLPALDALVLCGGGKSTGKAMQRIGRVVRTFAKGNKKDAIVVDTFDQAHFVREHSATRHGIYTTEPGYLVKVEPAMQAFLKKQQEDL